MIFLDPPFMIAHGEAFFRPDATLQRAAVLLAPDGIAMVRRESRRRGRKEEAGPDAAPPGTTLQARRRWGRNEVILYYKQSPKDQGGLADGG